MRSSDFVGRWKFFDGELFLHANGVWRLTHDSLAFSWFKTIDRDQGKWMYALRNLGFARTEGGVGFRVHVMKLSQKLMVIAGPGGEEIELVLRPA